MYLFCPFSFTFRPFCDLNLTTQVICVFLNCADLSGKVFTFPQESNTIHAKLVPNKSVNLQSITVCLRFFTDLSRSQSIFSLATRSSDNAFILYKPQYDVYHMNVMDKVTDFWGLPDKLSEWISLCGTWESKTGLAQVWVNGKPSSRKLLLRGGELAAPHSIVLSQDQDNYGGGFDAKQSFVGHIKDVHMWDYVLSPHDIQHFTDGSTFGPGNVLNWRDMEYTTQGVVEVEDEQKI
ncbi:serum amyloid P-component-like [Scleropages formosus]|uniref:serum amyloid P-component-like n=1 Tax=Scleropages formosus TaxID=113540 RepID=UPI0010FAB37C|nr:serum amyloid P-component-like [Scleropages formosus]